MASKLRLAVNEDTDTYQPTHTSPTLHAVLVADGDMRVVELPAGGEELLGRSRHADIVVEHPTVSRQHAVLRLDPPMAIRDLGSANGTTVRGERILPETWVPIAVGEAVQIGDLVLVVRRQAHPPGVDECALEQAERPRRSRADSSLGDELRALERARILDALGRCGGNQTRAARELGIARGTLIARLAAYGVARPRKP
jgi:pSer/pThr/pTyr-binding forkhead associated (FHA) protein